MQAVFLSSFPFCCVTCLAQICKCNYFDNLISKNSARRELAPCYDSVTTPLPPPLSGQTIVTLVEQHAVSRKIEKLSELESGAIHAKGRGVREQR